jgi:tetratricopeptide (TPR) repeat protein
VEIEATVLNRRTLGLLLAGLVVVTSAIAAAPRWSSVHSESLTVIGDTGPGDLRDVARRLEQFRLALGNVVADAKRPPTLPTLVYVFGSRSALQPFLPLRDGRPAALRGYFHRDADGYAIAMSVDDHDEEASSIVFHEYAHLLLQRGRTLPIWLNEGLAEYFSTFALTARGRTADIGRPVPRHVRLLRERFLPLAAVLSMSAQSELYDEGERRSVFYAEAWALTHYLMTEVPEGPEAISRYIAEPAADRTADERFRDAFGTTPAGFEPRLKAYGENPTFRSRIFTLPARLDAESGPARTLTEAEAAAWLGDLQRRIGRPADAAIRIADAMTSDPKGAAIQLALGRLQLDQGRTAGALVSLSRAVTGDPSSATAFAWLAYAHMSIGQVAEARTAIDRALALEPGRPDFRLRDADISVLEGNVSRARAVLLGVMADDAAVAARARERLNAIDRRR